MNIHVKDFGVIPHDELVQTAGIQKAIDACAESGGGTVSFDVGTYRTGTIWLRSNTYLNIPPLCRIKGSDSFADYNAADAFPQNKAIVSEYANGAHLIIAHEIENCGIIGGGIIDGNGRHFGFKKEPGFVRPQQMISLVESSNVRIQNVELLNSAFWTCHVYGCENVWLTGLKVKNNKDIENCDGLDIDCSKNVVISDCIIDTQDDCITFRGCAQNFQRNPSPALENVTVTNCVLTTDCNAFRIGVGFWPIRNCRVSNVTIRNAFKGICLESRYHFNTDAIPGTEIENISFNNCYLDARIPIFVSSNCFGVFDAPAPKIRNISFSNMTIAGAENIVIQSNEHTAVENITFSNIDFDLNGIPKKCVDKYGYGEWDRVTSSAAFCTANVKRLTMRDVRIHIAEEASPINKGIICYGSDLRISNVEADRAGNPVEVCEVREKV